MNTRTALIALILTLLVAGGAFFLMRPAPVAEPVGHPWLASLDAAEVTGLAVTSKDGAATLERSAVPEVWLLRVNDNGIDIAWPVEVKNIAAALKLLGDINTAPAAERGITNGNEVTITLAGGVVRKLSFSTSILAGRSLVKIEGPPDTFRMADARLATAFTAQGLRQWRQTNILTSAAGEFSRVRLSTIGRQVIIAKVAGKWGVQSPLAAPADVEACAKLTSALAGISILRFLDQVPGDDNALGLAAPTAVIDTESDFRIAKGNDVERRTLLQQVKLGAPSDATGKKRFASLRAQWLNPTTRTVEPAWGPVIVEVKNSDFEGLSAELPIYISKQAVQAPSADVSTLTLLADDAAMQGDFKPAAATARSVAATRYLDSWRLTPPSAPQRDATATEVRGIDLVLSLLCEQAAIAIGREPPQGTAGVMRLKAEAIGASEEIAVGVAEIAIPASNGEPTSTKPGVVLRIGPIYRIYAGPRAEEAVRWLSEELPPEG